MAKKKTTEQHVFTEHIQQGSDGKYRWVYKLHMLKTHTIIQDVFWALFITVVITWLIVFFIQLFSGEMSWESFLFSLGMIGLVFVILLVLSIPAYLLVAAMYGWYYTVRFTMDEEGITHEQEPRQMKKTRLMGCLTVVVGLLARRPTTVGAGLIAGSRSMLYSRFTSVKEVKGKRRQHLIKVNETLNHNRIYVSDEEFDFVYDYISSRCKKAKKDKR